MRSEKALAVPGTVRRTRSISRAAISMSASERPITFTPTGVRMPVESMSMRALIGIVQALLTPGNCRLASISAISLSVVMPAPPFAFGLQIDDGLEHFERRRVGRRRGAPGFAEDGGDFRETT